MVDSLDGVIVYSWDLDNDGMLDEDGISIFYCFFILLQEIDYLVILFVDGIVCVIDILIVLVIFDVIIGVFLGIVILID